MTIPSVKTDFIQTVNDVCPVREQPVPLSRITRALVGGRSERLQLPLAMLVRAD